MKRLKISLLLPCVFLCSQLSWAVNPSDFLCDAAPNQPLSGPIAIHVKNCGEGNQKVERNLCHVVASCWYLSEEDRSNFSGLDNDAKAIRLMHSGRVPLATHMFCKSRDDAGLICPLPEDCKGDIAHASAMPARFDTGLAELAPENMRRMYMGRPVKTVHPKNPEATGAH